MPTTLAAISFSDSFQRTFDGIGEFLPKLVGAIAIFLIGSFIARLIRRVVHQGLTKVGADRLVDRSGLGGHLERAGYADSGRLIAQLVYIGAMLLVLQLTVDALDIAAITTVVEDIVTFIPKIIVAIVIVFIAGAIANFVRDLVGSLTREQSWGNFATNGATAAIWMIGVFAALDQIQVAEDIVDTLFQAIIGSLAFVIVIKYGVGGIWAARDRFWPSVYDRFGAATRSEVPATASVDLTEPSHAAPAPGAGRD